MTKFSEKFKSLVEAGMYTTTESIYHLKRLLALGTVTVSEGHVY